MSYVGPEGLQFPPQFVGPALPSLTWPMSAVMRAKLEPKPGCSAFATYAIAMSSSKSAELSTWCGLPPG